ncbi:MAG TPA: hypothetical protein VGE77_10605 [Nocardioides sp.]
MPPTHRAELRGRLVPPAVRRVAILGTVALLTAGLVSAPQTAFADEPRTLRSIDVTLTGDGSVAGVTSRLITESDGEVSTTEESIDPSEAELPVRVLTAYRAENGAGTDLADLAGYDGRLTIDVTVQNTSVRPERVVYSSEGRQYGEFALVGSPLTVVGGVALEDSTRVVTAGAEGEDVTNGVLGRDADGAPVVQWSAMLAPPRLATTATFRLVLDAEDFQPPTFDLSVQPGLVTDPSVEGLVQAAFVDRAGSARRLQQDTIGTIDAVNDVLTGASTVLTDIRADLESTASGVGAEAVDQLQGSRGDIPAQIADIVADLRDKSAEIDRNIGAAGDAGAVELDAALGDLGALVGPPGVTPRELITVRPVAGGCDVDASLLTGGDATLRDLFASVEALFAAYADASGACAAVTTQALTALVGTRAEAEAPAANCPTPAQVAGGTPQSVTCQLASTGRALEDTAGQLATLATDLVTQVRPSGFGDVAAELGDVQAAVTALTTLLAELSTTDVTAQVDALREQLVTALAALRGELLDLQGLVADTGVLATSVATIQTIATEQLSGSGTVPSTLVSLGAGIDDLLGVVCTPIWDGTWTPGGSLGGLLDQILGGLTGLELCPSTPEGTSVLETQLEQLTAAWTDVLGLVDVDVPGALAGINTQISLLGDALGAVETALGAGTDGTDDVVAAVDALQSEIDAARIAGSGIGASGTTTDCASAPAPGTTPGTTALDQLAAAWSSLDCQNIALTEDVGDYFDATDDALAAVGGDIDGNLGDLATAQESVDSLLQGFIAQYADGLSSDGGAVEDWGSEVAGNLENRADRRLTQAASLLQGRLGSAGDDLVADMGATGVDLGGTSTALVGSLDEALRQFGSSGSGRGILGALASNASTAGQSQRTVFEELGSTTGFAAVRRLDLRDVARQQRQFELGADRQEELTTAGVDADGTVLTVYTFHVVAQ